MSKRKGELVLLMDGVIRFVEIGDHVGIWPRTIHIGQVCAFLCPLMRPLDG
jgi:hypothetical protein